MTRLTAAKKPPTFVSRHQVRLVVLECKFLSRKMSANSHVDQFLAARREAKRNHKLAK